MDRRQDKLFLPGRKGGKINSLKKKCGKGGKVGGRTCRKKLYFMISKAQDTQNEVKRTGSWMFRGKGKSEA